MHAVMGYAVFCFFGWLIFRDRQRFLDAWRSRSWKSIEAIVTDIKDHSFELDAVSKYSGSYVARFTERFYTFQYVVNGVTYESNRYSFDGHLSDGLPCLEVGSKVTAYYNPANPQQSVVRRGLSWYSLLVPCAALYALVWGCWHSV